MEIDICQPAEFARAYMAFSGVMGTLLRYQSMVVEVGL